ncbi:hypothetical protein TD95_000389 [Thielaviopsis punctulata]|uniref:DUF1941 family protein n=1 Tax=Thielaviopsis punctulata TaxID=72032 RepID=A0A0F4Z9H9_9PEZI|nr:hypothetical protein TD95_000389 [Thielaviopsis punctulata]
MSAPTLPQVATLLSAPDDTSRFVGLALLHSILDNSSGIRTDATALCELWDAVPASFLDRLLKAGAGRRNRQQAPEMASLAASVVHAFAALLPDEVRGRKKAVGRIPALVQAVLYCDVATRNTAKPTDQTAKQTTEQKSDQPKPSTLQTICNALSLLVSTPSGADTFLALDITSLTESAPVHKEILSVLSVAWLTASNSRNHELSTHVDSVMTSLVAAFSGTDGVTLLGFVAEVFPRLDCTVIPPNPKWLPRLVVFIQTLVLSRPSSESRTSYTLAAAALIHAFPTSAPDLLFAPADSSSTDKPFVSLLINLVLIDIRSSCPSLLAHLNSPSYAATSARLAAAYDICSTFVGHLLRCIDTPSLPMDLLLKLRHSFTETLTLTIEYLRDRWDASIAGAPGLHPDARGAAAEGVHHTLTWDSASDSVAADPFVLAALRTLAVWLAEDDAPALVRSAAGLIDMFLELYTASASSEAARRGVDFRDAVLVALGPLAHVAEGCEGVLAHNGWAVLTNDLVGVLEASRRDVSAAQAARATGVVRVLLPIVEAEPYGSGVPEEWLDMVTRVAAWDVPEQPQAMDVVEAQVAALQLVTAVLMRATKAQRKHYMHSMAAVAGVETRLREKPDVETEFLEALKDVHETIDSLRV